MVLRIILHPIFPLMLRVLSSGRLENMNTEDSVSPALDRNVPVPCGTKSITQNSQNLSLPTPE